jgi:O-acetyl-ADP-ribose deacetylase (regulator of RNase III)
MSKLLNIIESDITKLKVDTIVNSANRNLRQGGGVCGAIFKAAGESELRYACSRIGKIQTSEAVLTDGFALPAKHIIHVAAPKWHSFLCRKSQVEKLVKCYENVLNLAKSNDFKTIAFPLISAGIYGFPRGIALEIAANTIIQFLKNNDMQIYIVLYKNNK